ncbi:hypothetical protein K438DRAFT_1773246 [Mycena galopus ATCC 62051]|nr:hypothetical protein K438DRAFT_1773246 [Mycena galopus ATCC 62051]
MGPHLVIMEAPALNLEGAGHGNELLPEMWNLSETPISPTTPPPNRAKKRPSTSGAGRNPPQTPGGQNRERSPRRVIQPSALDALLLGGTRKELGVEVYPGFAAAHSSSPSAPRERCAGEEGVRRGDARRGADAPAHEWVALPFRARATLIAGGAHGSLAKQAVAMYGLRRGKEAQK